jgi:hypothetical protein
VLTAPHLPFVLLAAEVDGGITSLLVYVVVFLVRVVWTRLGPFVGVVLMISSNGLTGPPIAYFPMMVTGSFCYPSQISMISTFLGASLTPLITFSFLATSPHQLLLGYRIRTQV